MKKAFWEYTEENSIFIIVENDDVKIYIEFFEETDKLVVNILKNKKQIFADSFEISKISEFLKILKSINHVSHTSDG